MEGQSFLSLHPTPPWLSLSLPPSLLCAFWALSYFLGNGGGCASRKFSVRRGETGQSPLMSSLVQNTRRTKKVTLLSVCLGCGEMGSGGTFELGPKEDYK